MPYEFAPGDRVLVATFGLQRQTGTLRRKTRLPWNLREGWVVELDTPPLFGRRTQRVGQTALIPLESVREPPDTLFRSYELKTGDRVLVTGLALRGHTGTVIRRTRLPWNLQKAWIVDLDTAKPPGGKRQPIGEGILVPLAEPPEGPCGT
ncbi:MAG: hypothetical protein AVDCRST_MAG10-662 [uncultured Acidimicrobiales bacterium]|uniref:Uncharacterized protein n=1 Tax=uncultured Acidimicrobiales bacterium TaxID=310071 RepID=A0A6J4HCS4_9ACTN|nr:MAG: hypothetical protein AVDCRST_MAG10-662 [uncultured Acidimicrobiales bacterium]